MPERPAADYEQALELLYRAPHEQFVAERKRLAGELKNAGHKSEAAALAKLERPPLSAWAVNQLYWRERETFDALLETAERLRAGDRGAGALHREATTALRARAGRLLTESGHAASEATLRRVASTLAALAAEGGFAPDPAGALRADRDAPGFAALEGAVLPEAPPRAAPRAPAAKGAKAGDAAAEHRRKAEAEAEAQRRERERARRRAERQRLEAELSAAKSEAREQRQALERLERERDALAKKLERTGAAIARLESALAELEPD